jgi:hypothetical protein
MWKWFIAILAACFYLGLARRRLLGFIAQTKTYAQNRRGSGLRVDWASKAAARCGYRETPKLRLVGSPHDLFKIVR